MIPHVSEVSKTNEYKIKILRKGRTTIYIIVVDNKKQKVMPKLLICVICVPHVFISFSHYLKIDLNFTFS